MKEQPLLEAERRRAEALAALHETGLALSAELDLPALLRTIIEHAARLLESSMGGLYLLQPDSQTLKLVVGHNLAPSYIGVELRIGEGLSGRIAQTGEPIVVGDYAAWPDRAAVYDQVPFRAVVGVPIKWRNQLVGVINVSDHRPDRFGASDVELLRLFATQAAVAIQNARLYETSRHRAEEMAALHTISLDITATHELPVLLQTIVERAVHLLDAPAGGLYLCDPERQEVRCVVSYNTRRDYAGTVLRYGEGAAGIVAQTGQPLRIDDYRIWSGRATVYEEEQPFTAVLSAPMIWQRQVTGVIHVLHYAAAGRFTQADLEVLSLLAGQAAIAVENTRLLEAEREQRALAEALRNTAATLNSTLNLDEVFDRILINIGRIVPHDAADVMLVDAARGTAQVTRSRGYAQRGVEVAMREQRFVIAEVRNLREMNETGQPIIIPDTHAYPGWVDVPETAWIRSHAGAPIRVKGQTVGFLNLNSVTPNFFTPAYAERLQAFADQAAIAIENARLFREAQQHARHLALLNDITNAAIGTANLSDMLQSLADRLGELIDADGTYLTLWDEARQAPLPAAAHGPLSATYTAIRVEPGEVTMTASVLRAGHALIAEDVFNSPHISPRIAAMFPSRSILGLPLIAGDQPLGAALIAFNHLHHFSPDEIARCEQAARQIALAVHKAHLLEAEREQHALAESLRDTAAVLNGTLNFDEVLDSLLAHVGVVMPHDAATLMLIDERTGTVRVARSQGYAERRLQEQVEEMRLAVADMPHLRDMLRSGHPVVVSDTRATPGWVDIPAARWVRSYLGVPICIKGHTVGFLNLDSATPGFFTPTHADRLQAFADQAAIAVENARLYEAARRRLDEQTALLAASNVISSSLDLNTVLNRLTEQMVKAIDATSAYLCDWDPQSGIATVLAEYVGPDASPQEQASDLGRTYHVATDFGDDLDQWLLVGKPIVSHIDDPQIPEPTRRHLAEYGGHSALTIPLVVQGNSIGYIDVWESRRHRDFTPEEIALYQGIAQQAAIAIQNARLHDQVRRHAGELEQRVAERTAELDRERGRLRAILDTAGEAIYFMNTQQAIQYINPSAERLTGYSPAEAIGRSPARLWRSGLTPKLVIDDLDGCMARGETWHGEVINRRKDGTTYDAVLIVTPLKDESGQTAGFVVVQRNITREKELDRLKHQFVSRIGHELRTPLANIKLHLDLLERGKPEKRDQYRQILHRETERLRKLVEGFLEVSHLDAGVAPIEPGPTDVSRIAAKLVAGQRAPALERGLSIDYRADPDLPLAFVDPALISRAMSIVLENALNYTPRGGHITVTTAVREVEDRPWVSFSVQDTGPGLSQDDLSHLFERFYRGQASRDYTVPGVGLGLPICKAIVEKLGGRISVENRLVTEGNGATFTIWLKPSSSQ